jgi:hypothetical protein
MRNEEQLTEGLGIANIPRPALFGYSSPDASAILLFYVPVGDLLALMLW